LEFRAWHEKSGYICYAGWNKGKFKREVKAGDNNLCNNNLCNMKLGNMDLAVDQFNQ
jgi:hypothetical protein